MLTPGEKHQYQLRTEHLRRLGFTSYADYLHSSLWQSIRRRVLLPGARCRGCGGPATQVHHDRYRLIDLDGTCITHLVPVCGTCHSEAEFNKLGQKIGPQRATAKLDTIYHNHQKEWRKRDREAAWRCLWAIAEEMRQYLGMEQSIEAQKLVEQFDLAKEALPPPPKPKKKAKKR